VLIVLAFASGCSVQAQPTRPAGSAAASGGCPRSVPTRDLPPGETAKSWYFGNGQIWVGLWPDSIIQARPEDVQPDSSIEMKFGFWRASPGGRLELTGRRLDATTGAITANVPEGMACRVFRRRASHFPRPVAGRSRLRPASSD
jgi:hypothetical protein